MPHWLHLMIHMFVYAQVAGVVLIGVILYACVIADWLRARGLDPILREEVHEWEAELGRTLTKQERASLAIYNHG